MKRLTARNQHGEAYYPVCYEQCGGIGLLYKTWLDDTREQRRQETIEERRKIR